MTKVAGDRPASQSAVSRVRTAVKRFLAETTPVEVMVAVSGGADSLALAAATASLVPRAHAIVVDHGLQADSAQVADTAAKVCVELGLSAEVRQVTVDGPGGMEAAARRARYRALRPDRGVVLLGHTQDDQAETVLLGLGRGSGPRSIAGMRPFDPPWGRPLLTVSRATTHAACAELGLRPWIDPHNVDPAFMRVRLRHEVLPALEEILQGGVAAALARTAAQLREDNDALDELASGYTQQHCTERYCVVAGLTELPTALRRRVLRSWLLANLVPELTDLHLREVDALLTKWHGQGGVWLPGGFVVSRSHGRLIVTPGLRKRTVRA